MRRTTWKDICSGLMSLLTVGAGQRFHARVFPQPDDTFGWFAYREGVPWPELGAGSASTMQGAKFAAEEAIYNTGGL